MNAESDKQDHQNKTGNSSGDLPSRQFDPAPIPSETAEEAGTEKPNKSSDYAKRHYWLQVVLAVVGVAVAIIYWRQLVEMHTASTIAAENYALQTKALHIDQRAWVAEDSISGKPEEGKPYQVTVVIKNTGKTFAKKFAGVSAIRVKQLADPDPIFEDVLAEGTDVTNTVGLVAPNGTRQQTLSLGNGTKMTNENLEGLKTPTIVVLAFGKITYEDIFKCGHWSIYCFRGYVDGTWETYGPYNDADENECP